KLMELGGFSAFESLRDVGHHRNRGSPNLILEPEVLAKRRECGHSVELPCQNAGLLPSNQILKPLDPRTHHSSLLLSVPITRHLPIVIADGLERGFLRLTVRGGRGRRRLPGRRQLQRRRYR